MRVPEIRLFNINKKSYLVKSDAQDGFDIKKELKNITDLRLNPCYYPITFGAYEGSGELRKIVKYGIPCMYSGIEMIDPQEVSKQIKKGSFSQPSGNVVKILEKYENSITGKEREIYEIIKERSKAQPEKTIEELIHEITPIYRKQLKREEIPIFNDLLTMSGELPDNERIKLNNLLRQAFRRIENKDVDLKFSASEFKYKLTKIKDDIILTGNYEEVRCINKIFKESKKLPSSSKKGAKEEQKKIMNAIEKTVKYGPLSNNKQLIDLIRTSKLKLEGKRVTQDFKRKAFIYDLCQIVQNVPNDELQDKLINKALELPTSASSLNAYIVKISSESSDKICFRLLWPAIASIEHILPQSEGGPDELSNYGLACARANSMRKSTKLKDWFTNHPEAKENCQKYVDRLIELYNDGKFPRKLSPQYILAFANQIYEISDQSVKLDTSELNITSL